MYGDLPGARFLTGVCSCALIPGAVWCSVLPAASPSWRSTNSSIVTVGGWENVAPTRQKVGLKGSPEVKRMTSSSAVWWSRSREKCRRCSTSGASAGGRWSSTSAKDAAWSVCPAWKRPARATADRSMPSHADRSSDADRCSPSRVVTARRPAPNDHVNNDFIVIIRYHSLQPVA